MLVNKRKHITFVCDNDDENHKIMFSHDVNTEQILTKVHGRTMDAITKCDLLTIYDNYIWEIVYNAGTL